MKSVSVLMSTYNGSRYVDQQLESIRKQTHQPSELWISDQGSTDETLRIVKQFAESVRFPVRICYSDEQSDWQNSLVTASLLCMGDLVAFSARGDCWHPDKLARCIAAADHPDVMMVAHSATIMTDGGRYGGFLPQGIANTEVHGALKLGPWEGFLSGTIVVRRELLTWMQVGDFMRRREETGDLRVIDRSLYVLAHGLGSIVTIAQPLAALRQTNVDSQGLLRRLLSGQSRLSRGAAARRLRRLEDRATRNSDVMVELALAKPPRLRVRSARAAALYWQRMATICGLRAALHEAPTFTRRRAALERLVALGSYGDGQGLAGRLLVRDTLSGLLQLPAPAPLVPDVQEGPDASRPTWVSLS
jgi:hypothetical protein